MQSKSLDWLHVRHIETMAIIGVYPHERLQKQKLVLDLHLGINALEPNREDELSSANSVDYAYIYEKVLVFLQQRDCFTLERLALDIVALCFRAASCIQAVCLELHKPDALPHDCHVSISLERFRA